MQSPFVACQSKVECLDFKTNISYSVGNAQSQRKAILWRPDKRQHLTSIMSVGGYCGQFITFSLGLESEAGYLFSQVVFTTLLFRSTAEKISVRYNFDKIFITTDLIRVILHQPLCCLVLEPGWPNRWVPPKVQILTVSPVTDSTVEAVVCCQSLL